MRNTLLTILICLVASITNAQEKPAYRIFTAEGENVDQNGIIFPQKGVYVSIDLLNSIKITYKKTVYYLTDFPRIWGFLGCSLRGLLSSFLFGLLAQSHEVMLCGLLVGLCYLIPTLLLWKTKLQKEKCLKKLKFNPLFFVYVKNIDLLCIFKQK